MQIRRCDHRLSTLAIIVLVGVLSPHCKKGPKSTRGKGTSVERLAKTARTGATEDERESAVVALGKLGRAEAIEVLAEVSQRDSGFQVRRRAAAALGRIRHVKAAERLAQLWRVPKTQQDRLYDLEIQQALIKLGDLALGSLRRSLKHASFYVRWKAVTALEQIANPSVIPDLRPLLQDPNPTVQDAARQALKTLQPRK